MKLFKAFNVTRGDVIAFIGAGGKTSTLVSLGHELAEIGWRVLATTTTDIPEYQLELMPHAMMPSAGSEAISQALSEDRFVFLYDRIIAGRVYGPSPDWITQLLDTIDSDVILVEADQSGGLPLKAAYQNEPFIPSETSLVIPVVSLSVLGQPLDEEHVYNVESIIERYGFNRGNRIKSPWIAQVIRDEELGLRNIPSSPRVIAFLNQTPLEGYGRARARLIARLALRQSRLHGVAIGASRATDPIYEIRRPVGAVVLAAGLSSRMGQSKVLLPWTEKKRIIEHIVEQLISARIEHIVVVTGHMASEVKALVKPMGVKVIYNRSYKSAEMLSSLKIGLHALPDQVSASLVVLGDQPRIQPKVIYRLLKAYAEGKGDIVVPSFENQRGHPVLIDRRFWPDIWGLPRGSAPRMVLDIHKERIHEVAVETDSVIRDIDTPDDYSDERWRAGLK
jgi:molybdenum cofactor cytidylyltransferase